MSPFRPSRHLFRAAACGLSLAAILACSSGGTNEAPSSFGPAGPLTISCTTADASVIIGSGPTEVIARVTRNGSPVAAQTVTFTTTRGTVSPASSTSDGSGDALSFFQASATAGTAIITARAVDSFNGEARTCTTNVAVTQPRDPRLSVQLLTPPLVAGLTIRVVYNSARVTLPSGAVYPLTPFTAANGCYTIASDNDAGEVTLNMACATLRAPAGDVARFEFEHVTGDELNVSDFSVTCTGFDERGAQVSAACSATVLQL